MGLNFEICNAFNKQAAEYEKAAKIQLEIGQRLFERLEYLKIKPRYVLDLGCGTGIFSLQLKKRYREAQIIGLDLAQDMLLQAKKKQSWRQKWSLVNADMNRLPFADGLFDLIFANQTIHWSANLALIIGELNRVMNPGGCLMFSTLGPDTFKELKQAWQPVDHFAHTNDFVDMHDIGDCLLAERFLDPVMDMEFLQVHYPSLTKLLESLKKQGVRNIHSARNKGLTSRKSWKSFEQNYQTLVTKENKYPLTYEVVYGHAWKGEQRRREGVIETLIPISKISRQK